MSSVNQNHDYVNFGFQLDNHMLTVIIYMLTVSIPQHVCKYQL